MENNKIISIRKTAVILFLGLMPTFLFSQSTFDRFAAVKQYLSKDNLTELMRVKDKGNNVKIYVKNGSDAEHVKELLMFVKSNEKGQNKGIIILLTGNIDLKQISKLTAKMNIPGGENLKKIH